MSQNSLSPEIRALAQRLITHEAVAGNLAEASSMAAVLGVSEKLRRPFSTLAGSSGFRSLLARSLTLAKTEAPGLGTVQVKPDGSLEGLSDLGNQGQDSEAGILLIAQLLGLLVTFIGEGLMLSLVLDAWPDFTVLDTLEKRRS